MADLSEDLGDYQTTDEYMDSYDPIPVGKYEAMITTSTVEDTRSNNGGRVLKLTWTVMSGRYEGRLVFDNVNIRNPSDVAVEIGRKKLNSITAACGYPPGTIITNSSMLENRLCIIDVKIQAAGPDKNGIHREARNTIRDYAPSTATRQAPPPPPAPAAPHPATQPPRPAPAAQQPAMAGAGTGGGKPPWLTK